MFWVLDPKTPNFHDFECLFQTRMTKVHLMLKVTLKRRSHLKQNCNHRGADLHKLISIFLSSNFIYRMPRFIKHTQTQTPEESGIFLSCSERRLPLFGTPVLHMCRYRYYSAHKTPQSHLKVVSCWNTLAASKLGSRLCRLHRPSPPSAHHTLLQQGIAASLLLLDKPVPIIKTLNGSPLKGNRLFLSEVIILFNLKIVSERFSSLVQKK